MILKTPPRVQKTIIEKQSSSGHRDALALAAEEAAAKIARTRPCKRPASASNQGPNPKQIRKLAMSQSKGGLRKGLGARCELCWPRNNPVFKAWKKANGS